MSFKPRARGGGGGGGFASRDAAALVFSRYRERAKVLDEIVV